MGDDFMGKVVFHQIKGQWKGILVVIFVCVEEFCSQECKLFDTSQKLFVYFLNMPKLYKFIIY